MNLQSLRFAFKPCSSARTPFRTQRYAGKYSTWTSPRQNQSICNHAAFSACASWPNMPSESTIENDSVGVISCWAVWLTPHLENNPFKVVLERFGPSSRQIIGVLSFSMPGLLPSSPCKTAATHLFKIHRVISPQLSRFHKHGRFRFSILKRPTRPCTLTDPAGFGLIALTVRLNLLLNFWNWPQPTTPYLFCCSALDQALTFSLRVVRNCLNSLHPSLPCPGACTVVFVSAVRVFAP